MGRVIEREYDPIQPRGTDWRGGARRLFGPLIAAVVALAKWSFEQASFLRQLGAAKISARSWCLLPRDEETLSHFDRTVYLTARRPPRPRDLLALRQLRPRSLSQDRSAILEGSLRLDRAIPGKQSGGPRW